MDARRHEESRVADGRKDPQEFGSIFLCLLYDHDRTPRALVQKLAGKLAMGCQCGCDLWLELFGEKSAEKKEREIGRLGK